MKSLLILLVALVLCSLASNVEHRAILKISNPDDVKAIIKRGISIDHPDKKRQTFEAYLTGKDFDILEEHNIEYELQPEEHFQDTRSTTTDAYHDYDALQAFLVNMETTYPTIARKFTIGQSRHGKELWGIEISDNVDTSEQEPQFQYIANMHGDETVGREMCIRLIELLCTQYGEDDRISRLVNETHIFIIPSMNPDGFASRTRGNANLVDLNRNFPDQFSSPSNTKRGREPEVVAIMNFVESHNFVLGANFHGGAVVANYPYDGNANWRSGAYSAAPDDNVFKYLALTYSNAHTTMHNSWEFSQGITNGAEWYVLYGGMQDWNYVYNEGSFQITVELSEVKYPHANTLEGFWGENKEAMLAYMELTNTLGVKGTVTNLAGAPLVATISVVGNSRTVKTNPEFGDYYRLLMPGTYSINASCPGYASKVKQVTVAEGTQTVLDFTLSV